MLFRLALGINTTYGRYRVSKLISWLELCESNSRNSGQGINSDTLYVGQGKGTAGLGAVNPARQGVLKSPLSGGAWDVPLGFR